MNELSPEPAMKVMVRYFRSKYTSWDELFEEAATFATAIGPDRLINISHSEDDNDGIVVVWYWD